MPKKPTKPAPTNPRGYTPAQVDSVNAAGQRKVLRSRARDMYIKTLGEKEYKRRLI